jgi:hypothetical protein
MSLVSGKPKAKRTLRVATVFTGVAAAAVGMTQAANAQEVGNPAAKPTSKHIGDAIHPDGRINGSIRSRLSCAHYGGNLADTDPTWLHVSTANSAGYGLFYESTCFGYKGLLSSPYGVGIYAECGGNNHGYIDGTNGGRVVSVAFGPGTTYRKVRWTHYDDVLITSWTGTDKCPGIPNWRENVLPVAGRGPVGGGVG